MSWWIELYYPTHGTCMVPNHREGGTILITNETSVPAELNVTYNYAPFYRVIFGDEGIHWLHNRYGYEVKGMLIAGTQILGTEQDEDYWAQTKGNAGHALSVLLQWVTIHPEATLKVT